MTQTVKRSRKPKLHVVTDSDEANANGTQASTGNAPPAEVVVSILADLGTFILAGESSYWRKDTDEGVDPDEWTAPVAVRSPDFRRMLQSRWKKLTPRSQKLKDLVDACDDAAWMQGERKEAVQWTRAKADRCFQIAINSAVVVEVDATGFRAVRNGHDAVFTLPPGWASMSWGAILSAHRVDDGFTMPRFLAAVCADLPDAAVAPANAHMTKHEMSAVLMAYWFGAVMMSATTARPVLALLGEYNSGKSTTAAIMGRLFFGPDYQLSGSGGGSSERAIKDLHATMIAKPWVCKDDMNAVSGSIVDQMCQIATGMQVDASEHRETMKHASFRVQSNLMITAHTPRWAMRADLLSRMVMIRIARASASSLTQQERYKRTDAVRAGVWADTFYAIHRACTVNTRWVTHTRFDDWEQWVRKVAESGGWHAPMGDDGLPLACGGLNSALWKQTALRVYVATCTDDWLAALHRVAVEMQGLDDRWYTATDLYDLVCMSMGAGVSGDADKRPSAYAVRSPHTLGQFLGRIANEGSAVVEIHRGPLKQGAQTWRLKAL